MTRFQRLVEKKKKKWVKILRKELQERKRLKNMEKLKQYKYIILIVVVVLGFAFYWYEARPSMIKKECSKELSKSKSIEAREFYYKRCLRERGL